MMTVTYIHFFHSSTKSHQRAISRTSESRRSRKIFSPNIKKKRTIGMKGERRIVVSYNTTGTTIRSEENTAESPFDFLLFSFYPYSSSYSPPRVLEEKSGKRFKIQNPLVLSLSIEFLREQQHVTSPKDVEDDDDDDADYIYMLYNYHRLLFLDPSSLSGSSFSNNSSTCLEHQEERIYRH